MNVYCDNCGKGFDLTSKAFESTKRHYCSKECTVEHRRKPIKKICICCGEEFEQSINGRAKVCYSNSCQRWYKKWFREPNVKCKICGTEFWCRNDEILTLGNCCSRECSNKDKEDRYKGVGNHQYNVKGASNASYKGEKIVQHGYIYLYVGHDHPFSNKDGRIREHRYIAEQFLMEDEHKITIDGKCYLSPNFDVHHINENKLDNRIENLQIVTKSEHTTMHNYLNPQPQSTINGKFISKK